MQLIKNLENVVSIKKLHSTEYTECQEMICQVLYTFLDIYCTQHHTVQRNCKKSESIQPLKAKGHALFQSEGERSKTYQSLKIT